MTSDSWIERVRAADAEAEEAWNPLREWSVTTWDERGHAHTEEARTHALIAIAAELRAQRIARRPGAGQ